MKTFADVLEAGFRMLGICGCGRDEDLDLSKYDPQRVWAGKIFRCRCGRVATVKVIATAATLDGYKRQTEGW